MIEQETTTKDYTKELRKFWVDEIQSQPDGGHNYIPKAGEFRASSIPLCARKNLLDKSPDWVDLEMVTQEFDYPVALGTNVSGTLKHEFIQNLIKNKTNVIAIEPHIKKEFRFEHESIGYFNFSIQGHIDLILQLEHATVIDIKSYLQNPNYDISNYHPNPRHLAQLSIYMGITGISQGQILYVSRQDLEPRFYDIDDPTNKNKGKLINKNAKQFWNDMLTKTRIMRELEILEKLPPVLSFEWDEWKGKFKFNYQCNYCECQNYCFPDGISQKSNGSNNR